MKYDKVTVSIQLGDMDANAPLANAMELELTQIRTNPKVAEHMVAEYVSETFAQLRETDEE